MSDSSPPPPANVTYGEALADSLRAQAEFLKGTGDFADVGSLESLLPLEESIRKKTAQTDTDILRQTLLGDETQVKVVRTPDGRFGIPDGEVVMSSEGPSAGRYQLISHGGFSYGGGENLKIFDTETGGVIDRNQLMLDAGYIKPGPDGGFVDTGKAREDGIGVSIGAQGPVLEGKAHEKFISDQFKRLNNATPTEIQQTFKFENPYTGEPLQEGQTITVRDETGMVDLLGDRRAVQEFDTKTATQADVDAGLATEVGDSFVAQRQTQRQAGFDDTGNFMGLAAMAEDIQRGNLSRQREADLQDVARLSGLYGEIMEEYKPGTTSAMTGAKDLIEGQKENLLRNVGISDPEKVASQGVQADPLRQQLMTDAEQALGQGLTDREERQIAEAARARSTMMGRTFDQSGAIAEAEARVAEDNQRRMQNRAFAQHVLGQEAGIQTADDTRRLGADQFNVGAQMDAERLRESLRQQGLLGYLDAASRVSQIENQESMLDPFQAILGRGGGTALQQGQSVFGQAGYGLQSQPQYLRPEAGLGFIQNQATNAANMYAAQQSAAGAKTAGIFGGLGALGGGIATGILA